MISNPHSVRWCARRRNNKSQNIKQTEKNRNKYTYFILTYKIVFSHKFTHTSQSVFWSSLNGCQSDCCDSSTTTCGKLFCFAGGCLVLHCRSLVLGLCSIGGHIDGFCSIGGHCQYGSSVDVIRFWRGLLGLVYGGVWISTRGRLD